MYRSSPTLQLACRNGHLIFRNKIHSGTHRQNPLLAAARESGHIPPSFSNKAINAVPSPVWPRSQQRHTSCLVPIGHDFSYAIPAVSSPLATISATPYQLSRPHWPRAQLYHTSCLVPIGHELSFTIPAVSSPLATSSATPYQLSRPHWPRAQLYHTSCLVPIGHELSFTIPAVSSPLATSSATPYQLSRPHRPRAQLRHTSCLVPIAATSSALPYQLSRPHWPRFQLLHTSCLVPISHELSFTIPAVSSPLATSSATPYLPLAVPVPLRSQLKHLYTSLRFTKCAVVPRPDLTHALTPIPRRLHQARYIVLGCGSFVRGRKRKKGDSIPFILPWRDYPMRLHGECP